MKFNYPLLCAALLAAPQFANPVAADETSASGVPTRKESLLATVTASVEAIDLATREVTLKGPMGNSVTFTADKRVKRLDEVKVGDFVRADYYVSVAAELRNPTPEEEKSPLTVLTAAGKAPLDAAPAAGGVRAFKVVTTIEGLDRPTQTVTVKGPLGHYVTARVKEPSRLTQMRIGDNIVVTYTEAVAISLEKVNKSSE